MPEATQTKQGYECTVTGQYYAVTPMGMILEPYTFKCRVPALTDKKGNPIALHWIVRFLLDKTLKSMYNDYHDYRTHEIVGVVNLDDPANTNKPIQFMARKELVKFVQDHAIGVMPELYNDIGDLRQAIIDYQTNPEAVEGRAHVIERRKREHDDFTALAKLNPILSNEDDMDVDIGV